MAPPGEKDAWKALAELSTLEPSPRNELRFIAAGASTEEPHDVGRRAGEIAFEPRSWR